MEAALESGDIRTLANLNETAMALLASLRQDLTSDDRYLRTMMNQRGASPEDIAYADALTRQLGQARRIINMTESAARQEREGGTTAAKFGVPLLGDIAAQGLAEPGIAASKEATEQASRSIRGTAGSQARAATVLENSGEDLLTILRDKGIIDTDLMNWAGIAEPTYDPDIEADVQAQSQRRLAQGGRRATSPAWQQTAGEMEKIGGSVPRLGAEEAGMAEVPTPQRRRMAAENAVAKSRFSPEALANIQDIGEREAEVQPPGHAAAYRKAADEAELRGLGTGTTDVAVSTEDGDVATISVANARSEQSKKLFRNLLNAFTGGEETKEGRVAEQQAGKVLTE
jgi:hypothetical protein